MSAPAPGKRVLGLEPAQASAILGLVAAAFVAVMLNVIVARHFRRWDWTRGRLYTLSEPTVATLHSLPARVEIWVLLGAADPLSQSLKQLLVSYATETDKLDIHYVDPDRDALALLDVRKRFKIEAGRTEDGRVITDASIVVASGERHWYLLPTDMVEVSEGDDPRTKPKEEQALTLAIRNVLGGEKARLCFSTGHDEMSISDPGPQGLGVLRDVLEKDNYETASIDARAPDAFEPFKGCALVLIAGPRAPFEKVEEARLKTYLLTGGNLFAALSPIGGQTETGLEPPGLADALAPFGVALDEDVVIERDGRLVIPNQVGAFMVTAKTHPVTAALVKGDDPRRESPRIILLRPRSLHHASGGTALDLLGTTDSAFGVTNISGAARWPFEGPDKSDGDLTGPLVLAMASERPKTSTAAPHGPRAVVIGTASVLQPVNWNEPIGERGAAFFVESAISWLASRPAILDVPDKPSVASAIRITEESRDAVWRYVVFYMPIAGALFGFAVALRRRSTEGKGK